MKTLDSQLIAPIAPSIKQRNAFFDALFYDIGALTTKEKDDLSPWGDREGSVINVPPAASGRPISHYPNVRDFLNEHHLSVRAVVVAGVGSSVLGTAALARNVANVYDIDVAGIVSGYGASDMLAEAMGGWFFYGATDVIRQEIREAVNRLPISVSPLGILPNFSAGAPDRTDAISSGRDVVALDAILNATPPKLSILVGHSKGDLLLDFALERFATKYGKTKHQFFDELRIVTFGALTDIPPQFRRVYQFIGAIDWFGGMNSRFQVSHTKVPNAWHHLNTSLPFHMPAEHVLKEFVPIN